MDYAKQNVLMLPPCFPLCVALVGSWMLILVVWGGRCRLWCSLGPLSSLPPSTLCWRLRFTLCWTTGLSLLSPAAPHTLQVTHLDHTRLLFHPLHLTAQTNVLTPCQLMCCCCCCSECISTEFTYSWQLGCRSCYSSQVLAWCLQCADLFTMSFCRNGDGGEMSAAD